MGKIVDITEKLKFEQNPVLKIRDVELEVNADAKTMLEIMGLFKSRSEIEAATEAMEKLFGEGDRKKLESLNLSFRDYMTVMSEAMDLIQGDSQGE